MDSYSPEDAAGDLMLEVGEPRPTHDLRTPGAWRWLAPLAVCVTFAGAVAISIIAVPEPAEFELAEPLPGMSAPDHVEPLAEPAKAVPAPEPGPEPEAEASPLAPDPATLAAASPARTDAPAPRVVARTAAASPVEPHAEPEPSVSRLPDEPAASSTSDDDLPSVDRDDEDDAARGDDADEEVAAPDEPPVTDDDALDAVEPALPGSGA